MYAPRLRERYRKEIVPAMMQKFGYKNSLQAPRVKKIVLNVSIGDMSRDDKILEGVQGELAQISGQKPVATRSKKAIAGFKIRKGSVVGCKVTLRRAMMYEFLDRLINIAIPRIRDFRGLSENSFDGAGNYSFGIKEQSIFPEIDVDKITRVHGMDVTIETTARTRDEAYELLKFFGVPFRKQV